MAPLAERILMPAGAFRKSPVHPVHEFAAAAEEAVGAHGVKPPKEATALEVVADAGRGMSE